MRIQNQGFSLIEVMVSAGLLALVVLSIADSAKLANRGNSSDSMSNDFAILEQNLFNVFSTPACDQVLTGVKLNVNTVSPDNPQPVPSIAVAGQLFAAVAPTLSPGLNVTALQFTSAQPVPFLGPSVYQASFTLQAQKQDPGDKPHWEIISRRRRFRFC